MRGTRGADGGQTGSRRGADAGQTRSRRGADGGQMWGWGMLAEEGSPQPPPSSWGLS